MQIGIGIGISSLRGWGSGNWFVIPGVAPSFAIDIARGSGPGYTATAGSVDVAKDISGLGQNLTASGAKAPLTTVNGYDAMGFEGTAAYYGGTFTANLFVGDNKPFSFICDQKQPSAQTLTQTLWSLYSSADTTKFMRLDVSSNNISVSLVATNLGMSTISVAGSTNAGQSIGSQSILAGFMVPGTVASSVFWNQGYVTVRGAAGSSPTGATNFAVDKIAYGGLVAGTQKSRAAQGILALNCDANLTAQKVADSLKSYLRLRNSSLIKKAIAISADGQSNQHGPDNSGVFLVTFSNDECFCKDIVNGTQGTDVLFRLGTATGSAYFGNKAYIALYFAERLKQLTAAMGVNGGTGLIPLLFDNAHGGTPFMGKNADPAGFYLCQTDPGATPTSTSYWSVTRAAQIAQFQIMKNLSAHLDIVKTVSLLSGFEGDTILASGQVAGDIRSTQAQIEASLETFVDSPIGAPLIGIDQVLLTEVGTRGSTQVEVEGQETSILQANNAFAALQARRPTKFMKVFTYNGRYGTGPFSLSNLVVDGNGSYVSGTDLFDLYLHRSVTFQRAAGYKSAETFVANGGLTGLI